MKRASRKAVDELRSEYKRSDFGTLVRGKYAARLAKQTNVVVLDPEVAEAFPNDEAVNKALKGLIEVAGATAHVSHRSAARAKKQREEEQKRLATRKARTLTALQTTRENRRRKAS
jgi:hypothetical protein